MTRPLAPFVVLLHQPGKSSRSDRPHLDWMFLRDNVLRTFATDVFDFNRLTDAIECAATSLPDHRIAYLKREGSISGDRGDVRRVAEGTFLMGKVTDDQFAAGVTWRPRSASVINDDEQPDALSAELIFYRSFASDARLSDAWRFRLSPCR